MKNGFIKGFVTAIASVMRDYDEPTLCREVCESNGFSLKDFKKAGLDDYDLEEIKKVFKE